MDVEFEGEIRIEPTIKGAIESKKRASVVQSQQLSSQIGLKGSFDVSVNDISNKVEDRGTKP
jgi:cytoskeletal protein CcmA (bactofilin family)